MMLRFGVPDAGGLQEVKLMIRDLKVLRTEQGGINRSSPAMTGIGELILPSAVMEESKQSYHDDVGTGTLGQKKPVSLNSLPVPGTMVGIRAEGKLSADSLPEADEIVPLVSRFHL